MKYHICKIAMAMMMLLTTSCASTRYLSIDILTPAKVSFPENIVNVAIVDNAGLVLTDVDIDNITTEELNTSISKELLKSLLVQNMNEEKYFNEVKLCSTAMRVDKSYGRALPMQKLDIMKITKEIDVDAIVSIDAYQAIKGRSLSSIDGFVFPVNQVRNDVMFRVYDASGNPISPMMATSDSLQWTDYKDEEETQFYKELVLHMAEGMVKQIVPYWETQERRYFTDGTKLMKEASKQVEKGNWAEAAKSWGTAFENAKIDDKQKARIAVNIALANENLGDITNAATWVRIASNLINTTDRYGEEYDYISWYKVKLLERERDNPKVLEQMGVEKEGES